MSRRRTEGQFSGLHTAAVIVVLAGAVGSVGLLLRATDRNPSRLLVVLLALWVVSPFVALLSATIASKQWSGLTRVTLYGVMLIVSLSALAIYVADALWPRTSQGAFAFIVVPPRRGCLWQSSSRWPRTSPTGGHVELTASNLAPLRRPYPPSSAWRGTSRSSC